MASAVLALHVLILMFNLLGPLWCWKRPRWRLVHLASLALVLVFFLALGRCPLTDLEHRARGGASAGGLIERGLEWILYWEIPAAAIGAATAAWLALWAVLYARAFRAERR